MLRPHAQLPDGHKCGVQLVTQEQTAERIGKKPEAYRQQLSRARRQQDDVWIPEYQDKLFKTGVRPRLAVIFDCEWDYLRGMQQGGNRGEPG